jgi:hypothetical protein
MQLKQLFERALYFGTTYVIYMVKYEATIKIFELMTVETLDGCFGPRLKSYHDCDPTRKFESKAVEERKLARAQGFNF